MWIIVATGVYTLLLKFPQKNSPHDVQTKGGGGFKGLLNNVKKTALFSHDGFPNAIVNRGRYVVVVNISKPNERRWIKMGKSSRKLVNFSKDVNSSFP